jgi:pimeloyl-ACP methyl ester carboxylesterase
MGLLWKASTPCNNAEMLRWLILAVANALILCAAVHAQANAPAQLLERLCPFAGEFRYARGAITCFNLRVPENRDVEQTRSIDLLVVRVRAWGQPSEKRDDAVIYLSGGPGAPVTGYVRALRRHPVGRSRDLYFIEQRGTGVSAPFCEGFEDLAQSEPPPRSMAGFQRMQADRVRSCFERAAAVGVDLRAYNTVEIARDVRAARLALGLDSWNLWGVSYGSRAAQMVMRIDSDGVRAAVLDSIVPNDLAYAADYVRKFDTFIADIEIGCETSGRCAGVRGDLFSAFDALETRPIIADAADPAAVGMDRIWVPPVALAYLPFVAAYDPASRPALPTTISRLSEAAVSADGPRRAAIAAIYAMTLSGGNASEGLSAAVRCNDGFFEAEHNALPAPGASEWEDVLYSHEGSDAMISACEAAGLTPRDRTEYALPQSATPALVVNGVFDPITPLYQARYVHEGLVNSRLIPIAGGAHGSTRRLPACAASVMTGFFDDPRPEIVDISCLEAGHASEPPVGFWDTTAAARVIVAQAHAPDRLVWTAGLAAGLSAVLAIGLVVVSAGAAARWIDRRSAAELAAQSSGLRPLALLAACASVVGTALLVVAVVQTLSYAEIALLAGLTFPGRLGAALIALGAMFGAFGLWRLFVRVLERRLRVGSMLGFALMNASAIGLFTMAAFWDLAPI